MNLLHNITNPRTTLHELNCQSYDQLRTLEWTPSFVVQMKCKPQNILKDISICWENKVLTEDT